jgi:hypothetical protein
MRNATYISPKIQNEITATCGDIIIEDITNRITHSSFFSVLADETTDVAGMAQLSLCIRYVDNVKKEGYIVRDDFIGFTPVKGTMGPRIKAAITKGLQQAHFDLGNLRGQGYDGASALGGCAALISKDYPSASEKHMDMLKEQITSDEPGSVQTKLVKLSETRRVERHDAISFFKEMFMPIYDTLEVIVIWDDADVSLKAFLMWSAMEKSCFVVGLFCISSFQSDCIPISNSVVA